MKTKLRLHILIFFFSTSILFISCNKEHEPFNVDHSTNDFIHVKNGVLIFPDQECLHTTLKSLSTYTYDEFLEWESELNFRSQMTIFNNIVRAELEIDKPYIGLSKDELKNVVPPEEHSDIYYQYLEMGVIKEIYDFTDNSEYYDYSVCLPQLSHILNVDGIFMVNDTIFQVKSSYIKCWENGDINNLDILKKSKKESGNICFIMFKNRIKSTMDTEIGTSGWVYDGNKRLRLNVNFDSWQHLGDGTIWQYHHYVNIKAQKKVLWFWRYEWTDIYIKGYWNRYLEYEHPVYLNRITDNDQVEFPTNYPSVYHIHGNNAYISISAFYGHTAPHKATFGVSWEVDGERARITDIDLDGLKWYSMGFNGLEATINW